VNEMLKKRTIISLVFVAFIVFAFVGVASGCTIGVASGKVTTDGRAMIWKIRDWSQKPNNEVYFNCSYKYKFVAVANAGERGVRMGLNEKGLALMNSNSTDMISAKKGPNAGEFQETAIGTCATVDEFEALLKKTNVSGRKTRANIITLDATGAVAIFETSGNEYFRYDATDPNVAPDGFIIRSNFAFHGWAKESIEHVPWGVDRYNRSSTIIKKLIDEGNLDYKNILHRNFRDFSEHWTSKPYSVPLEQQVSQEIPLGYIQCHDSLCRDITVSAAVVVGVLPGEESKLSTLWSILGQTACGIAIPYWPVGETPPEANGPKTAPLCDAARNIKTLVFDYPDAANCINTYKLKDGKGDGLWKILFPAEDRIFAETEAKLAKWRKSGPDVEEMLATESKFTKDALATLEDAYKKLQTWKPNRGKITKQNTAGKL